jgi:glucose/arabinose dehydrogenase
VKTTPPRGSRRRPFRTSAALAGVTVMALAACGDTARLTVEEGSGPQPMLPAPRATGLPTVNVAKAVGWTGDAAPTPAAGTRVVAFARGLDHPRWLLVLPDGSVLVAETGAPAKEEKWTLRGWIMGLVMARAGAPSSGANRITLLRDTDGDGVADVHVALLTGLHSPFGMALIGPHLYVANTDAVLRFPYVPGDTRILERGTQILALPGGPINHHWTKNLIASPDGRKLYVTIGSNSNVAERGMAVEDGRAAIWEIDVAGGTYRIFASGLRNPNGLAWDAQGRTLWAVVNERDGLGSDLVPDYLTAVRDGGFYGWPYSYHGNHVDARVTPSRPDLVARAIVPDYALGPHTASLGLASSEGAALPGVFRHGMFVGQHGSWNRKPRSGYKVIFVPFEDGRPSGRPPIDVLTDFLDESGNARGRPVGVALDTRGALLVADDVGNVVWRVTSEVPGERNP